MRMSRPNVNRADAAVHGPLQPDQQSDREAYIAELIEITLGEDDTIRQLNGCVARLGSVQAAKQALLQINPAELRAALFRHLPTELQPGEPR